MREAFADELVHQVQADPLLMVLDGDCATSTMSSRIAEKVPSAFLNVGIAEQNMVGVGAGLAAVGYRVVLNSFAAMLVHRAGEQLLQSVALPGHDVIVAGHYAGLSAGPEGAPHHAITDLGAVRAMPNFTVWTPFDGESARAALAEACSATGPHYIRLSRQSAELPPPAGGMVAVWDAPRGTPTVTMVAIGDSAAECLAAQQRLLSHNVLARVVAPRRLKPLPEQELRNALSGSRAVFTVEEHNTIGGLASALCEMPGPYRHPVPLGIPDCFTESGPPGELRAMYGLDAAGITRTILQRQLTTRRSDQ